MSSGNIHALDVNVSAHYASLDQRGKVLAEYVWIGGSGNPDDLRCKTKTLNKEVKSVDELPVWNYDGSSTGQAPGKDSEVYLKPVKIYPDPFRGGKNILVLCESCLPDGKLTPIPTNTRRAAKALFDQKVSEEPWFGIEQEYTLFHSDGVTPLGWPKNGYPGPQGPYYCSAGAQNAFGRRIVESHYKACLHAGLSISGVNAEVMPGQWEYQIGPCTGIDSGDQIIISRYLMLRVCEDYSVIVSFDPKPKTGDWNGAGCHTNYSTKQMREDGGYEHIIAAIKKLGAKHNEHIAIYGKGNDRRLTGAHETAPITKFSYGVANRGASVRIPRQAKLENKGYFEDRRPASNMDPYLVTSKIFKTTCLD
jgi:glutamine synthetase